jgi:four helix bundle protein
MNIKRFEDLPVWQDARKLTKLLYDITGQGNFSKDYRLKDQIRASSVSIMSNIAEGYENMSNKQFVRYLYIAKGSSGELRSQLYVALDAGYLDKKRMEELKNKKESISKQCSGLITYLEGYDNQGIVRERENDDFISMINEFFEN